MILYWLLKTITFFPFLPCLLKKKKKKDVKKLNSVQTCFVLFSSLYHICFCGLFILFFVVWLFVCFCFVLFVVLFCRFLFLFCFCHFCFCFVFCLFVCLFFVCLFVCLFVGLFVCFVTVDFLTKMRDKNSSPSLVLTLQSWSLHNLSFNDAIVTPDVVKPTGSTAAFIHLDTNVSSSELVDDLPETLYGEKWLSAKVTFLSSRNIMVSPSVSNFFHSGDSSFPRWTWTFHWGWLIAQWGIDRRTSLANWSPDGPHSTVGVNQVSFGSKSGSFLLEGSA